MTQKIQDDDHEANRRSFFGKLLGVAAGAGIVGLLLGREGVKPAYAANTITPGVVGGAIAGGDFNKVTDDYGFVGGGSSNRAGNDTDPTNDRIYATVAGGNANTASGDYATIGGGYDNTASGARAMVPGGWLNTASGQYSFAAGRRANTQTATGTVHDGAFVWADSNDRHFYSSAANEFAVRCTGGARFVTAIDPGTGNPTVSTVIDSSGRLGVGTTLPQSRLYAVDSTTNPSRGVIAAQHNDGAQAALMQMKKSRGTESSPAAIANGDYAAAFNMNTYDGSNYLVTAGWGARINGTVTAGSVPTDLFFYTAAPGTLDPYGQGRVRLVISSAGNVGVGTTAPTHLIHLNGGAYCDGTGAWVAGSSIRWKENIEPLTGGVDMLKQLHPVRYNRKETPRKKTMGFIAEEVGKVLPSIVDWDENEPGYAEGYDHLAILALAVEAIKALSAENEGLLERVASLERAMKQIAAS